MDPATALGFRSDVAVAVGVNAALLLHRIHELCADTSRVAEDHNGRRMVKSSVRDWHETEFTFLSNGAIHRALARLVEEQLAFAEHEGDGTWYSVNYDETELRGWPYQRPLRKAAEPVAGAPERVTYVYLMRAENGRYKIGISVDPEKRLADLRDGSAVDIELVHYFAAEDAAGIERVLHREYETKRVRGEWFALDEADVASICAVREEGCGV